MNGWTPASVTLDADGNVVSVTVTESRFTPRSVDVLLASRRAEGSVNEYGIPYAEAMDPANQFAFKAVSKTDWSADVVARAQARMRAGNKDADLSAVRWSVEKAKPSRT